MTTTLKDALVETLQNSMSHDGNIRTAAEQQLKVYEVIDDYGCQLVDLVLSPALPWPLRQLAGVLLKQYIINHWKAEYEKHEAPEVPVDVKGKMRMSLLAALSQDCDLNVSVNKKLKGVIAYAVYAIGHYDYPDEWPELLPVILNLLSNPGNRGAVYSSVKVLAELCHDVTESQVPAVTPMLLPKLLEMMKEPKLYDIRTRGRAIQIFTFIVETFALLEEVDKKSFKTFLMPFFPDFMDILVQLLQFPSEVNDPNNQYPVVDTGLRKEIISCLTILLKSFRKQVLKSSKMQDILSAVWHSLTSSAVVYVNTIVNSDSDLGGALVAESLVDSDGEDLGQDAFIFSLFEFVSSIIESPKTRKLIKTGISDLLYYVIIYLQMTDEQVAVWSANPDQYVEDEDEESYSFSVRLSAKDVLMSLMAEYEDTESKAENEAIQAAFVDALKRHFMESNQIKMSCPSMDNNNQHTNWWKVQEACLLALGSMSETFVSVIQDNGPLSTDVKAILENVFSIDMHNLSPFFVGRCLWTAARFTPIMPPATIDKFLQGTVTSLAESSAVMKISAVRAVYSFSSHLKDMNQTSVMKPYLVAILDGLVNVGVSFDSEVQSLVLETICILASVDVDFTACSLDKMSSLAVDTFLHNSADPVLISCCQNVFKELSKNPACVGPLQGRIGPTLASVLTPGNSSITLLQPAALDILTTLVRSSPTPLSDVMMALFSSAVSCILSTAEDNSTLQNGGECIRGYVSRSTQQVMEYQDERSGQTGASLVMQVCLHLLDPRVHESCAAFVGKLLSVTISKASPFLGAENVHLLLRSVLSKLQTAEALSVVQSLLLVFAHLIHSDLKTVLDFLSSIPGPTGGQSALEFVLTIWLSRQHMFFGNYDKKVSLLALGNLLHHSVQQMTTGSSGFDLNKILVPGDPVFPDSTEIVTRSKAKAVKEWTRVPCSVKILKVIIGEIGSFQEAREEFSEGSDDEDGHDDDSIEDIEVGPTSTTGHNLSGLSGDSTFNACDEDDDDFESASEIDPDEMADPIRNVALDDFLLKFVRSFGTTAVYGQFVAQLNDQERQTLNNM